MLTLFICILYLKYFRGCEELRKIDLTLASQCTNLRVRGANAPGPPKSRYGPAKPGQIETVGFFCF